MESKKQTLVSLITELCLENKCHPTELAPFIRKQVRENKDWKGQLPPNLVLEAQRSLTNSHPEGWL